MSKSVTIPTYMQPDWVCTINNTTYRYKAGTTQTVPDEVAALIANYYAAQPVENPPVPLETEIANIATQIADEKIAAALANHFLYFDFTRDVHYDFEPGTPLLLYNVSKDEVEDAISHLGDMPVSALVNYDSAIHHLTATCGLEDAIIFSSPLMGADGAVTGFLALKLYVADSLAYGLLQFTEMPE